MSEKRPPLYWENELRKANERADRLAEQLKVAEHRAWQAEMVLGYVCPPAADIFADHGYDGVLDWLENTPKIPDADTGADGNNNQAKDKQ